jgi:hypothetical protein
VADEPNDKLESSNVLGWARLKHRPSSGDLREGHFPTNCEPIGKLADSPLSPKWPLAVSHFADARNFRYPARYPRIARDSMPPPGGHRISAALKAPTGSPEIVCINKMGKPKTMVRTREGSRRLESAFGDRLANCERRATRRAAMSTCRCRSKASSRAAPVTAATRSMIYPTDIEAERHRAVQDAAYRSRF